MEAKQFHMSGEHRAAVPKYKLMIIGKTGVGKSSFGNFVLGRETFVTSTGLKAVTAKAAADSVTIQNYELYIIDTPGFGDPTGIGDNDDKVIGEMAKGLQLAVEDGDPEIDVIIYTLSASDRFTKEEHTVIESIKDSAFWSHVLVVFTNADRVCDVDKRHFIHSVLEEADCPEALKLMMQRVDGRFMILNSLDSTPAYRENHLHTLLENLHSLKEKNHGKRYSHHLFLDIHKKYEDLKMKCREQTETVTMLKKTLEEKERSYAKLIDDNEATIEELRKQIQQLKQKGQNVDELESSLCVQQEEKRIRKQGLEDELKHLRAKIERCIVDFDTAEKQNLEQNIARLHEEIKARQCKRMLCKLL